MHIFFYLKSAGTKTVFSNLKFSPLLNNPSGEIGNRNKNAGNRKRKKVAVWIVDPKS
jgi:hypothetical protein